jgi:Lon protease-like protein
VQATELPLFPLSTVLFPGGRLDLRVFERRYLDMVRDCARAGSGFGVCVIVRGREAGEPAIPAAFGTVARITDFSMLPDGLLGITARGAQTFHVERTRVRDSGLVIGEISLRDEETPIPVPAEYGVLVTILERLAEQFGGELAAAERACFDDASWVGYRLAEVLPLTLDERQRLLQTADPVARLQLLADWLPRFQRA